jgi:formylglycine-generating enzyme required for sulfatase activity
MTPELDQLLLTLSKSFNLTSQEIADTLWLTLKRLENFENFEDIPRSPKPNSAPVEPVSNPSNTDSKTTKTDNSSGTVEETTAGIYPKTRPINRQIASDVGFISLRVPDAPSLREPLTLLRALRPLMRRVPSPTEEVIDEVATVNTIAENGVFLPVMQPILEPWLELNLVVDESISMLIWRHTISELKRLFEHYGIFRDVSTWAIATDKAGKPRLRRNIGVAAQEMNFAGDRELIDPSGRSLIVVVSDCVSDIWRNGEVLRLLQIWTQTTPLAILQMLPERMWQRTGLALGSMVRLASSSPGVPNRELVITKQLIWDDIEFETAIKVPVFSLERELVKKWSKMVAAQGSIEAVGFIFSPDTEAILDSEEVAESPTLNPQERVQNFHLSSSPLGVRLAILLAAAPVINLPIVRLIQKTLLPDSDQVQVAEVFLGGLLKPLTPIDAKTNPDEVQYDFINEEIRNILLANAARSQAANVFQKVSEYIAAQLRKSLTEFVALLKAPNQEEDIQSFASVSTQILRKLGGEYAKFAEEVEAVNKPEYRHIFTAETVYVDRRGEIVTRETINIPYFDEILTKEIEPIRMIAIPQGDFWMGSPENEKGGFPDESPQHLVKVPGFFMSQTPITQAQWKAIASLPQEGKKLELDPSRFKGDYLPVEQVTWQDAIEFCARLSRATGRKYRLPNEAEWEYACRAIPNPLVKESKPFHFGETLTSNLANYDAREIYQQEAKGECKKKTTPVRSFSPNAFGLYDMHGNVWEWCLDPWHGNYEGAPEDGKVWDEKNNDNRYHNILDNINVLIEDDRTHVLRGGSWYYDPQDCRSAYRLSDDIDYYDVGFRPVFSVQDSSPLHS